jgi:hypothetical protein
MDRFTSLAMMGGLERVATSKKLTTLINLTL